MVYPTPTLGQVPWEPLPRLNPVPIVADLLDKFQICDEETYNQLLLDLYELGRFDAQGFEHNEVPWQGQMATSLHSCGNQLMGCPCGCRQYAFTDQRLQQGGLHGLLIKLEGTSRCGQKIYPNHRHISPDELALLNGMFPGIQWGVHARMALCALGQMASPIHSCWVGSLMMKHLHQHFGLPKAFTPKEELCQLICRLLQARDSVFGLQHGPNCKAFQSRIERELLDPPCSGKPEFFTDGHTHAMPFPTAAPTAEVSSPTVPTERPGTRDEPTGKGVPHLQPPTIESKPGWPPAPQCTVEVEEKHSQSCQHASACRFASAHISIRAQMATSATVYCRASREHSQPDQRASSPSAFTIVWVSIRARSATRATVYRRTGRDFNEHDARQSQCMHRLFNA